MLHEKPNHIKDANDNLNKYCERRMKDHKDLEALKIFAEKKKSPSICIYIFLF
jgi:hypothetical protein